MPNVRIIAKGQRGEQLTKLKVNFAPSQSSTPSLMPETNSVYLRRATEGTGELMELVGGSVAWNQLCNSSSVTGTSGHKFYLKKSGAESITNTNTFTGLASGTDMVTDLTQMLGSAIADYVYSLEQATAGSGVAWLKSYDLIDGAYHAYSAPTLQSVEATAHVTKGKNNYPLPTSLTKSGVTVEPTTDGKVRIHGTPTISSGYIRFDNVPIVTDWVVGRTVTLSVSKKVVGIGFTAGSSNGSLNLTMSDTVTSKTGTYTSGNRLPEINVRYDVGAIDETIAIQLEVGNTATEFSPYMEITTALDSSVILRGIYELVNGEIRANGDTYEWDGTVNRRFAEVDLGTLNWQLSGSVFYAKIDDMKFGAGGICAYYYNYGSTSYADFNTNAPDMSFSLQNNNYFINVKNSNYSTAAAFKTAMSGVKLVYELADVYQTTESADPYTAVQTVEDGGTEEFVTTNGVPVGVVGRFANAVPMEGVDSFTVTANDGTVHTYPVTLSEEIYRGYVDMLTGEAISEAASIAEYNGETIATPWLSSLDVYSAGATPTKGAQVVYPITPEEVTATITGDPTELGNVVSVSSTEGTVDWSEMAPLDGKCIVRVVS